MLVIGSDGALADHRIADLPDFLRGGDIALLNDTRVMPARLEAKLASGGKIEILIIAAENQSALALASPARKLVKGTRLHIAAEVSAEVLEKTGGEVRLRFDGLSVADTLARCGQTPLPPYILKRRALTSKDTQDYQTIYARASGSAAAPTAGLHITAGLLQKLRAKNVAVQFATLHTGAGTFLPVRTENVRDHIMHKETGFVSEQTASAVNAARAGGGRVLCAGTTSLRLLESAALSTGGGSPPRARAFSGETGLFILPGYSFKLADMLLTNFHLPRSTLFMLVAAFCGLARARQAYAHAIACRYRFYSYGDACLIFRPEAG